MQLHLPEVMKIDLCLIGQAIKRNQVLGGVELIFSYIPINNKPKWDSNFKFPFHTTRTYENHATHAYLFANHSKEGKIAREIFCKTFAKNDLFLHTIEPF